MRGAICRQVAKGDTFTSLCCYFNRVRKIAKRGLLALSCLSVRRRGTPRLPMDRFS